MRLDKFLKVTGLFKRRAAANEACNRGRVLVDGVAARPAKDVSAGQTIAIQTPRRRLKVRILTLPDASLKKDERDKILQILEDTKIEEEWNGEENL